MGIMHATDGTKPTLLVKNELRVLVHFGKMSSKVLKQNYN